MPKYNFACEFCNEQWSEWLGIKDPLPVECPHCEQGKPYKVPTKFVTINKKEEKKSAKENVIDHIEENRKILKQMKTEAIK
tara:strand:- start:19 stop:261 length:243 start_codon:yes stop_codon:yes gene_type:complete